MMSATMIAQPPIQPERRPHRPRDPRERRAAVRVRAVHVVVRRGDQQHRDERHEQDRGRLQADARHRDDEPERRRQRVARRRRGDADDEVGHEAERVRLQPLSRLRPSRDSAAIGGDHTRVANGGDATTAHRVVQRWMPQRRLPSCTTRQAAYGRLSRVLTREPGDVNVILPFDEVVAALGRAGERDARPAGRSPLDSIVGTVDRTQRLRPQLPPDVSARARALGAASRAAHAPRRAAAADRRLPRRRACTSCATATTACRSRGRSGWRDIDALRDRGAHRASAPTARCGIADLPLKSHERLFLERVPLPDRRARAHPPHRRPGDYARAGRGRRGVGLSPHAGRGELARPRRGRRGAGSTTSTRRWSSMLREADLIGARHRGRRLPARGRASATGSLRTPRVERRRPRAAARPRAQALSGDAAASQAAAGAASRRVRFSPDCGSKRCSLLGVQPQPRRLALAPRARPASSRATTCVAPPASGRRPPPASAASSASSSDRAPSRLDG